MDTDYFCAAIVLFGLTSFVGLLFYAIMKKDPANDL